MHALTYACVCEGQKSVSSSTVYLLREGLSWSLKLIIGLGWLTSQLPGPACLPPQHWKCKYGSSYLAFTRVSGTHLSSSAHTINTFPSESSPQALITHHKVGWLLRITTNHKLCPSQRHTELQVWVVGALIIFHFPLKSISWRIH